MDSIPCAVLFVQAIQQLKVMYKLSRWCCKNKKLVAVSQICIFCFFPQATLSKQLGHYSNIWKWQVWFLNIYFMFIDFIALVLWMQSIPCSCPTLDFKYTVEVFCTWSTSVFQQMDWYWDFYYYYFLKLKTSLMPRTMRYIFVFSLD